MKKIVASFSFTSGMMFFLALCSCNYVLGQHVSNCFASDPAMGSTNRNDHYSWAKTQVSSRLAANVKLKIDLFYNCPSVDDYTFRASFASVSAIIGKYTQNSTCFTNDPGAKNSDVRAHYDWAKTKTRQQLFENLQGKITEGFKCMSRWEQEAFFADISASIAQTAKQNTGNPMIQNGGNNSGSTQTGEWKVWVKTSPCSGRNDWISVAKQNPTGGGNFFYQADQIFSGTSCTTMGCTFAEATTIANTLRTSNEFFRYCCRDYSVWENSKTKQRSVVQGKFGNAGGGWNLVKPDLCYEEAQALATLEQVGDWKVWVKTSPCSGRNDWITVAKENPAYGGGGGVWYPANQILTTPGMGCTNITSSCSFAAANSEAAILRKSSEFSKYCCNDYSVWKNDATGKMSIVQGKFAIAGFGWSKVSKELLCCEEAEALAGIPGACSGTTDNNKPPTVTTINCPPGSYRGTNPQTGKTDCLCPTGKKMNATRTACIDDLTQVKCWPGSHLVINPQTNEAKCYCNPGLVWNSTQTACVEPAELVKAADCSGFPGSYAAWDTQTQTVKCFCPEGKIWNSAGSACIDDPAKAKCWPGSHLVVNPQTNEAKCYCNPGLVWNSTQTACVDPQELVKAADCSGRPGSYAAWDTQTQTVKCFCPEGKTWNSTMTACVDITTTTNTTKTDGGGGGTGTWTLVSVTVNPPDPDKVWGDHPWTYSAQSTSATLKIYNGDKMDFQWTAPPQQFNSNGFTISLSAQATPVPRSRASALIGVEGYGLTSDTPADQQRAYAYSDQIGVSSSAQKSVTFKPVPNASEIEVRIGVNYNVTFYYKYKRAQ